MIKIISDKRKRCCIIKVDSPDKCFVIVFEQVVLTAINKKKKKKITPFENALINLCIIEKL